MSRALLFVLVAALAIMACGDQAETPTPKQDLSRLDWRAASTLNAQALNLMDQDQIPQALELFEELVARSPKIFEPRFNLGVALMNSQNNDRKIRMAEMDRAETLFRTLTEEYPERPEAHYILGVLLDYLGREREQIRSAFERAYELAPFAACAVYRLGKFWLEEGGEHLPKAERLLLQALELEPHLVSGWNSLYGTLRRLGEEERAAATMQLFQLYSDTQPGQGDTISLIYNGMGELGNCRRTLSKYGEASSFAAGPIAFNSKSKAEAGKPISPAPPVLQAGADIDAAFELFAASFSHPPSIHDLDDDGRVEVFLPNGAEPAQLWSWDGKAFVDVAASWNLPPLRGVIGGLFADVDHDGKVDLFCFGAGPNRLFLNRDQRLVELQLPAAPSAFSVAAQIADIDHDGDLDIHVAQFIAQPKPGTKAQGSSLPFRPAPDRLLTNLRPTLYETADDSPLSFADKRGDFLGDQRGFSTGFVWCDLDHDGDIDLFRADGQGHSQWLANDRLFRFRARHQDQQPGAFGGLISLDVDQDGQVEIIQSTWAEQVQVSLLRFPAGRPFQREALALDQPVLPWSRPFPADLDNDGDPDLIFVSIDGRSQIATNSGGAFTISPGPQLSGHGIAFHDGNDDGLLDLVYLAQDGSQVEIAYNQTADAGQGLSLALRGKSDQGMAAMWSTTHGTGAQVEVSAAGKKIHARSMTRNGSASASDYRLHLGLSKDEPDSIRILWSDFVLQSEAPGPERPIVIVEANRKSSSCPVLFVPDGQGGFRFVTDFLGVGGLGFFITPGEYAAPDRDETVHIGELIPIDDHYELRVHEPMEEICYLDSLQLVAIDHPIGTEMAADERLAVAEPMPTGDGLVIDSAFLPLAVRSDAGRDCLEELSLVDRIYQPDMALSPRFIGYLARQQSVEFDFDAEAIRRAKPAGDARLTLVIDGFVEYPYSHVNYAAWEAGVVGCTLSLDLKDDAGNWQESLPELGYPAGMTRCMTLDVSSILASDFSQVRLRSNLDVRIDRLRLAWATKPAPSNLHRRNFSSAELRFVGYPAEVSPDGREPKLYDYQQMQAAFDWKVMGGRYTAFGAVTELLEAADDRLVVMGHGEEIVLRVPVTAFPGLPQGMQRSFFLEAEGYCKDMDPYTAFPNTVGPLPHQGLIDYPFGLSQKPGADHRVRSLNGTFR